MNRQAIELFSSRNDEHVQELSLDSQVEEWLSKNPTIVIESISLSSEQTTDMLAVLFHKEPPNPILGYKFAIPENKE